MCVLLSHADINAGVGCVEGANQQASVSVHDTIVQMDLGGKKKRMSTEIHGKSYMIYIKQAGITLGCGGVT